MQAKIFNLKLYIFQGKGRDQGLAIFLHAWRGCISGLCVNQPALQTDMHHQLHTHTRCWHQLALHTTLQSTSSLQARLYPILDPILCPTTLRKLQYHFTQIYSLMLHFCNYFSYQESMICQIQHFPVFHRNLVY